MGIQGLQEFVEQHCPGAVVPVELQRLARGSLVGAGRNRPPQCPLRLVIDAENCLPRLYGGYFTDWVSGGQWNQMLLFLSALSRSCAQANIELVVFFNGALEKGRLHEWVKRQANERQSSQHIVAHVQNKGTPPPKVWFIPPVALSHFVRLALLRFRVKVAQSINDHHLEVIRFCKESGFHGLVAQDADYAAFCPPHYFGASSLKLSRNGKNLTASEFLLPEVARALDLPLERFPVFAALLGNHILPDEDLAAFHWNLLGPDHPLSSLKVRAHQLVLPPCDVVVRAASDYLKAVPNINDLDTIARDVFKHSQSQKEEKCERFKRAVQYYLEGYKACPRMFHSASLHGPPAMPGPLSAGPVPLFPASGDGSSVTLPYPVTDTQQAPDTSPLLPTMSREAPPSLEERPFASVENDVTEEDRVRLDSTLSNSIPRDENAYGKHTPLYERSSPIAPSAPPGQSQSPSGVPNMGEDPPSTQSGPSPNTTSSSSSDNGDTAVEEEHVAENHVSEVHHGERQPGWPEKHVELANGAQCRNDLENRRGQLPSHPGIPSLMSTPTRNHMDLTTPPRPQIAVEVIRVAEFRHRNGLMHPHVYQVLTTGELKLSVTIEDEGNPELPPACLLYRSARQYTYGILFSLGELRKRAMRHIPPGAVLERTCVELRLLPPVLIKEWSAYKGKSPQTPELVEALTFREWTCPTLRRLWLGKAMEDKNRRMRAFLACLRSDTPGMVNPAAVPTQHLVLCCVLRYMLQWPGGRILRRQELDAFLAQAVSPLLYKPEQLQELKIDGLDPRGVQLAALFMRGVEMVLFANDACGQPVPWEHCCPWLYFDGKLFQSKLAKAARDRVPLLELCDGQAEQVARLEKMKQSILEGLSLSRPPMPLPPPPMPPPPPYLPPAMMCQYPPQGIYLRPPGGLVPPHMHMRARGVPEREVEWPLHLLAASLMLPYIAAAAPARQGGKLEIAGMVVGQWAGGRRGRGRGLLPPQVVSVGSNMRGRGGRGGGGGRGHHVKMPTFGAKEEQNGSQLHGQAAGDKEAVVPSTDQSAASHGDFTEAKPIKRGDNGGVGTSADQSESALSSAASVCNTSPFLNALSGCAGYVSDVHSANAALDKEE
uniref:constitutive coactivator of PPAR-gamma-like protein 1 isoform X3 n=1 Tax=Myxine glutinosa TaxID=7769 RepID=UPI00358EB7C7